MNENPAPSGDRKRIEELEAEIARPRKELERANELKEGYKALYVEKEDWAQVEREMKEMMDSPDNCTLGDLIRRLEAEENTDAA